MVFRGRGGGEGRAFTCAFRGMGKCVFYQSFLLPYLPELIFIWYLYSAGGGVFLHKTKTARYHSRGEPPFKFASDPFDGQRKRTGRQTEEICVHANMRKRVIRPSHNPSVCPRVRYLQPRNSFYMSLLPLSPPPLFSVNSLLIFPVPHPHCLLRDHFGFHV